MYPRAAIAEPADNIISHFRLFVKGFLKICRRNLISLVPFREQGVEQPEHGFIGGEKDGGFSVCITERQQAGGFGAGGVAIAVSPCGDGGALFLAVDFAQGEQVVGGNPADGNLAAAVLLGDDKVNLPALMLLQRVGVAAEAPAYRDIQSCRECRNRRQTKQGPQPRLGRGNPNGKSERQQKGGEEYGHPSLGGGREPTENAFNHC